MLASGHRLFDRDAKETGHSRAGLKRNDIESSKAFVRTMLSRFSESGADSCFFSNELGTISFQRILQRSFKKTASHVIYADGKHLSLEIEGIGSRCERAYLDITLSTVILTESARFIKSVAAPRQILSGSLIMKAMAIVEGAHTTGRGYTGGQSSNGYFLIEISV